MRQGGLLGTLGFVAVVAAGCFDAVTVESAGDLTVPVPHGAVQAAIRQDSVAPDGSVTLVVRVMARDLSVGSFQGAVTFAPGSLDLISIDTPHGQSGEARVYNTSGFADGRIRFAGLSTTGFDGVDRGDGVEAFRFKVHPVRPVDQAQLVATLDVVGTETGTRIAADRVLPSPAVLNSTGRAIR